MDYSIVAESLPHDADGLVFDVHSLYAHLLQVADRRKRRGCRYALALILLLIVLAKLAGEDKPNGIAQWARDRAPLFVKAFDLPRPELPCANTYRSTLGQLVAAEDLEALVQRFLAQLPGPSRGDQIALDGKTLRGTIPTGASRGLHLLAAYAPAHRLVLQQVAVDGKENEISAAPRGALNPDLPGKVVSGDAMFAQRSLSQQVVAGGGDYTCPNCGAGAGVWTVKDNQPQLRADIEELFTPTVPLSKGFNTGPTDFRQAQTINLGHGRIEKRTLTASSHLQGLSDWPGLAQVFRIARHTELVASAKIRGEVVYGVTSLQPQAAPAQRLLQIVRQHWGIENGLHYRRDVTFHEDAGRTKNLNLAQAFATISNLVLALLTHAGHSNLAQARRHYAAHPDEALRLLCAAPT